MSEPAKALIPDTASTTYCSALTFGLVILLGGEAALTADVAFTALALFQVRLWCPVWCWEADGKRNSPASGLSACVLSMSSCPASQPQIWETCLTGGQPLAPLASTHASVEETATV